MLRNVGILVAILILVGCLQRQVKAWDGYDYDSGSYVEIEKGNLVRNGNDIKVCDYEIGGHRTFEMED